jgi:hypothetical protein
LAPTHELTDPNQQQQWLKYLFNPHFAKVHLHEDRPQASQRKAMNLRGRTQFIICQSGTLQGVYDIRVVNGGLFFFGAYF